MDKEHNRREVVISEEGRTHVTVYASLDTPVFERLISEGIIYSRREYVEKKYAEAKGIFLAVYQWFNENTEEFIRKDSSRDYPYWLYGNLAQVDGGSAGKVLVLKVPVEDIIVYRYMDWMNVLRFEYLPLSYGTSEEVEKSLEGEKEYREELRRTVFGNTNDVILTSFYPMQKRKLMDSWRNLFAVQKEFRRNPEILKDIDFAAATYCIRKVWIVDILN